MTPNIASLNIALHGEKDPVIAPPSHTIYFSLKTLNSFIDKLGFKKHKAFTIGFSSNSFFRQNKFQSSWVERPSLVQRLLASAINIIFKIIGIVLMPLGKGYHCFFWYRLK